MTNHTIASSINQIDAIESKTDVLIPNKLPQLLRLFGGGALVFAMYSYLFQGWNEGNDIYRYLILLGHTGLLAVIGLLSGRFFKESKGARLLLTLGLVSIPVNFSVLGALIYSQAGTLVEYPQYIAWSVPDMTTALITTTGSLLILAPVVWIGFTALARSMSKKLSLLFLMSNAMLLLPVREPEMIGMMVLGLSILNIWLSRLIANNELSSKTTDGLVSLGLQFIPLATLMGRSLWLYSMDLYLMTLASATVFVLLRQAAIYMHSYKKLSSWINRLSVLPALAMTPLLYSALEQTGFLNDSLMIPASIMVTSLMLFDISKRHQSRFLYQNLSAATIMLALLYNIMLYDTVASALIAAIAGVVLVVKSFQVGEEPILMFGTMLTVTGLVKIVIELVHQFNFTGWAGLTIFGITAILIASALETQNGRLKPLIEKYKATFEK